MRKISQVLNLEYQEDVLGEYVELMHEMANAIDACDEDRLNAVIEKLDKKSFIDIV